MRVQRIVTFILEAGEYSKAGILAAKDWILKIAEPYSQHGVPEPGAYLAQQTKLGRRSRRKLANNTYIEKIDADTIGIRLHRTYVVLFKSDGTTTINTGGWSTKTTKDRINNYVPCGWTLYSLKNCWYWVNYTTRSGCYDSCAPYELPFSSGDCIDTNTGQLLPVKPPVMVIRRPRKTTPWPVP